MELLQFIQTQTYYYPHQTEELKKILSLQQNQELLYSLNPINKIVQYHFNLQQWISLSDLIRYYKSKFLLVRFWQFLKIIKKMINYIEIMKKESIKYDYINEERVWINIKNGSKPFSVDRENVEFSIIIVGHGCPIFEQRELKPNFDEESITKIIKNIFSLIKYTFREYADKSEMLQELIKFTSLQQLNQKLKLQLSLNKVKQYKILFRTNRNKRLGNLEANLNYLWKENNCLFQNLRFIKMKFVLQQALHSLIDGLDYYITYKRAKIDSDRVQEFDELIDTALKIKIGQTTLLKIVNDKIQSLNSQLCSNTKVSFSIKIDELQKLICELEFDELKFYSFNSLKPLTIQLKQMLIGMIEFKIELLFRAFVEATITTIFNSLL